MKVSYLFVNKTNPSDVGVFSCAAASLESAQEALWFEMDVAADPHGYRYRRIYPKQWGYDSKRISSAKDMEAWQGFNAPFCRGLVDLPASGPYGNSTHIA